MLSTSSTAKFAFLLALGLQVVLVVPWAALPSAARERAADPAALRDAYGKLPLSFEANRGQTDARVDFVARTNSYTLFLTAGDAVLVGDNQSDSEALRLQLHGANLQPDVAGLEQLSGTA